MALRASRYSKLYLQTYRPDVAHHFPKNIFNREANKPSWYELNNGNKKLYVKHEDVRDSTLIHLTERFSNTELFLIGTMNTSDFLAKRTQELIKEVKPDVVFLQANEQWGKAASLLEHVKSQQEMNLAKNELTSTTGFTFKDDGHKVAFNLRWKLFKILFYGVFNFPTTWNPFLPGLEMKYALEEAKKIDSKVVYLGHEFDQRTWVRLHHENRYTLFKYVKNFITQLPINYYYELYEFKTQLHKGVNHFVESSCDQYLINWATQVMNILFPDIKRIIVDKKDDDLFQDIIKNKGKKMVCVVNQIHMEGIEHHWCASFGQTPRNQPFPEINPIGDMNIREVLFEQMYHVITRNVKSSNSKSLPASFSNFIPTYYREANFQYEHRNM